MPSRLRHPTRRREQRQQEREALKLVLLWADDNEAQRRNNKRRLRDAYPEIADRWEIIERECLNDIFETHPGKGSTDHDVIRLRVDAALVDHYFVEHSGGTADKAYGEELIVRMRSHRERYGVTIRIALYSSVDFPPPHVRSLVDRTLPAEPGVFGQRAKACLETWYQEFQQRLRRLEATIDELNEFHEHPLEITHAEKVECCRSAFSIEQLEALLRLHWDELVQGKQELVDLVDRSYRALEDHDDLVWEDENGEWWRGRRDGRGMHHLSLTQQQKQLLRMLMLNDGGVCKKEELIDVIWGYEGSDQQLQRLVTSTRDRLGDRDDHRWIETVRGIGYMGHSRGTGG